MTLRIKDITEGTPNNTDSWVRIPDQISSVGSPWSLVEDRFDKTAYFAETAFGYTTEYVGQIGELLKELETHDIPDIEVEVPEYTVLPIQPRPNMSDLDLDLDNWPKNTSEKPDLETLPDIPEMDIPDFDEPPPNYTDVAPPDEINIPTPTGPPINTNPALPPAPDIKFPDAPTLDDLFIPTAPLVTIPTFDATFIEEEIPVPANFNWNASPYNSDVWKPLLDKVIDGIVNGGTGLAPDVEQMIFDRAKYRQIMTNDRAMREIETYFSSRGYQLPPGAMAGRMAELTAEILRTDTDLNEKIAIEQAELAQKNTHFMIEAGRQAEVILREFHNTQENRTLDAAKTIVSSSIDIMNGYIAKQNAKVDVYKAEAAVFKEEVNGALAKIEIYKAEVEGAKVSAEVQKVQVDIYTAQIDAVETVVKVYTAQLQGVKILQETEQLKIEIFKVNTEIYSAQMAAEKIKADIYGTKVEAEKNKAIAYGEQVKAYIATLEARKTELSIILTTLSGKAQKNDIELKRYQTELGAYQTEINAKSTQIGAVTDAYTAEVTAYSAETQAQSSYYDIKIKEIDTAIQEAKFNLDKAIAEVDSATKGYVAIKELELKGSDGIMSVSAQLAASSLSAVHASANYGYSGNEGLNHSFNYGASISESHSIPHDPPQ